MTNNIILERIKDLNLKAKTVKKKRKKKCQKKRKKIKEPIKDVVIQIFKSEEITLHKKNINEFLNKLNLPIGREFFISLLSKNDVNIILPKEIFFFIIMDFNP